LDTKQLFGFPFWSSHASLVSVTARNDHVYGALKAFCEDHQIASVLAFPESVISVSGCLSFSNNPYTSVYLRDTTRSRWNSRPSPTQVYYFTVQQVSISNRNPAIIDNPSHGLSNLGVFFRGVQIPEYTSVAACQVKCPLVMMLSDNTVSVEHSVTEPAACAREYWHIAGHVPRAIRSRE
jgi:hypothetical protein